MHFPRGINAVLCTYCKTPIDEEAPDIEVRFINLGMAYKFCSEDCKDDWVDDMEEGGCD